jgi:hypothetical protein
MSEIKVGDKVKFLNSSGGGVVSRVIDSRTVGVLIEDGFEIPTMVSELVVMASTDRTARFFEGHFNVSSGPEPVETPSGEDERISPLDKAVTDQRKSQEIFLAFVPHDQKWLITGPLDIFFINNSSYDVLYNIFGRTSTGQYEGLDYGNVFPDSSILITTINREQLNLWTSGVVQFLFHCRQTREVLPPFNAEYSIDGKKFFMEGNYRPHPVIREKGIVIRIVSLDQHLFSEKVASTVHEKKPDEKPFDPANQPMIYRYQVQKGEAEVDLHIHELIEDPVNMEKGEILEFQKNFFLRCLDSAMAEGFRKLTVIHGVGNGVLKSVITDLLKKQEGISFTDAPQSKYGAGAMEIKFSSK